MLVKNWMSKGVKTINVSNSMMGCDPKIKGTPYQNVARHEKRQAGGNRNRSGP